MDMSIQKYVRSQLYKSCTAGVLEADEEPVPPRTDTGVQSVFHDRKFSKFR